MLGFSPSLKPMSPYASAECGADVYCSAEMWKAPVF
jgi:hypothetical protein